MKDEQSNIEVSAAAAQNDNLAPSKKRKYRQMEKKIKRLRRQYRNGIKTLEEFWSAITYRYVVKTFV
jgi:DNA-binding ferritin-like protein (Dps family)